MSKSLSLSILFCFISLYFFQVTIAEDRFLPPDGTILQNATKSIENQTTQIQICLLPPATFKPGREGGAIYTLVLDMDETLMHYRTSDGRLFIRPFVDEFLKELAVLYEIVIFTAGTQSYADKILNYIDPNKYISYRLYRQHLVIDPEDPKVRIKDLSMIGRELTRTLIIDNLKQNFMRQDDNGIEIKAYYDDPNDQELLDYIPFLQSLVENDVQDVRPFIREFKENGYLIQIRSEDPLP